MFDFLKKDPVVKAKKHIDRAMKELQDGYPDYASEEYEKAAVLFVTAEESDFAIKYFREAANCALQRDDHGRAAEMKKAAAGVLISESRFEEAGLLYSEASDHFYRARQVSESARAAAIAVLSLLAARKFDAALNLFHKAEKRYVGSDRVTERIYEFSSLCVQILCEGQEIGISEFNKVANGLKGNEQESQLFEFIRRSAQLALETHILLEWAGPSQSMVRVKSPVEFEVRYTCQVPVRVSSYKYSLSSSLVIEREPRFDRELRTQDSWLLRVRPVLSGAAQLGPFRFTLEGEEVLINKHTNAITFTVESAPPSLELAISPPSLLCDIGDEVVFDVVVKNRGDGPADNFEIEVLLSQGLEMTVGSSRRSVQHLGVEESIRFPVYVRPTSRAGGLVTVRLRLAGQDTEITRTASVRSG
ncbi:MAG: hypothetical protein QXS20_07110 [Candidatus Thorarchaeota archaeon]